MIVKHAIPGRTRFRCPKLKKMKGLLRPLEERLLQTEGILAVRCNGGCASIAIRYNPDLQTNSLLIGLVEKAVAAVLAKSAAITAEDSLSLQGCGDKEKQRSEVKTHKKRFVVLSLVTGAAFIKTALLGGVAAQGLLSPLGLIGAFFAIPLLKEAGQDLREKKRLTLSSFLAGGIVAALVFGEAATALEILWVHAGSKWQEAKVAQSARNAIGDILKISEKTAYVLYGECEVEVPVEQIQVGDIVVIHADEKISIDGEVVKGRASVDESPINGRSERVLKEAGAAVFAGTLVAEGAIFVRAEKIGDKTYLSRILFMVEDSLDNKAEIELEADRLANRLVKLGIFATALTWLVTRSFYSAFSVLLVMSCPCATILAASSAVSAAIHNAAKRGVLIKGGRYLEEAGKQTTFCFDKTGTLTDKTLEITDIVPIDEFSEIDVLSTAYVAEVHSRHPLGMAIRKKAEAQGLERACHSICDAILGKGVCAQFNGAKYSVGNAKLMAELGISTKETAELFRSLQTTDNTVMYVAKDTYLRGFICASNRTKDHAAYLLNELRGEGVTQLVMLSGDEEATAAAMAKRLNFDRYHASLLPKEKADIILNMQKEHKTAMVGDGINDVLALAHADLGIAMGAMGSDIAIETADIALADDDLSKIVHLRKLSKETVKVIHQNYALASGSNLLGVVLGLMNMLNPVMAGMIHIAHTGGIVLNSSRLLSYEDKKLKKLNEKKLAPLEAPLLALAEAK